MLLPRVSRVARPPRRVAVVAVLAAAAAFVTGCAGGQTPPPPVVTSGPRVAPASPTRPNIVFVLTDDLSSNLVRYMPHVQALEKSGTSFSNFSVTDSLCCPSRASIFTGKFPHDTGVFTNFGHDGGFEAFQRHHDEASTFATALHAAGYRTAMMGKYLNGYGATEAGVGRKPPGWSEWDGALSGYRGFDYQLDQDGHVVHYGTAAHDYFTDVMSRRAVQFIGAVKKAPFMLEVATFAPHAPYVPAPRDAHAFPDLRAPRTAAFDRLPQHAPAWLASRKPLTRHALKRMDHVFRKRVRSVQAVDRMIGALEAELRRTGQDKNTVFVFSSDNGYHIGEYRLPPGKATAFDTDIRVPLVVTGPGIPAGRVSSAVAENIDFAPTFEELAGLQPSPGVDGRSLVPILHGTTPTDWRTAALIEHHHGTPLTLGPDRDTKDGANPPSYEAMRTSRYIYVEYVDGTREFYDLQRDPNEMDNLAGQLPAATLAALHRDLVALENCHGAQACSAADRPGPVPGFTGPTR